MVYIVQRNDCDAFAPAVAIFPKYGQALRRAIDAGLEVIPYACSVSPSRVALSRRLPLLDW